MSKRINSRQKGKRIELMACKFLKSIGLNARRSVQYNGRGVDGQPDILCDELDDFHIEVKGVRGMDIGTKLLADAHAQAVNDMNKHRDFRVPTVLWYAGRGKWRLTMGMLSILATFDAREYIEMLVEHRRREKGESKA